MIRHELALSPRDLEIVRRATRKLGGASDFGDALRALREAVEEVIPGGRVFFLGATAHGPIVGSIRSGVGIVDGPAGVALVRASPAGPVRRLASFP